MKFVYLILILSFLHSCNKDKPAEGQYTIQFTYADGTIKQESVEITGVTKTQLRIEESALQKEGKEVRGFLKLPISTGTFYLDGELEGGFGNGYPIQGDFTETIYYWNGVSEQFKGEFLIL